MKTIAEGISRVRNAVKAVKEDVFLTDRVIYSMLMDYAQVFIKRDDDKLKLMRMSSLFTSIPCVELIEIDKIEACCIGISTGYTFMKTAEPLPITLEGGYGPLFRNVASIDGDEQLTETDPVSYVQMTKSTTFKYNKTKYYWYQEGHLIFPNMEWDAVMVDGAFNDDISKYGCNKEDSCITRQNQKLIIPEYWLADIQQLVLKELGISIQIPSDGADDKTNIQR